MATKKIPSKRAKTSVPATQQTLHHRLDALVHTIRCIAHYEDSLCELSHELKRAVHPSSEMNDELHKILERIPSHDYVLDLDAVKAAIGDPQSSEASRPKKSAKSAVRKQIGRR